MFDVKNHKQVNIFDPWDHLGPQGRKLLDDSWAGVFQQEIPPVLPVDQLWKHCHDLFGKPTRELARLELRLSNRPAWSSV
jgi:hypothetical protein